METAAKIEKKHPNSLVLFLFLIINLLIAVCYIFFVKNFNYSLQVNSSPSFALSPNILLWVTFGMIIVIGLVPYFLYNISNFKTDRKGLRLNYSLYYIHFILFILWSFFTYTLSLPIMGLIVLGIAIMIGIFTVYRFTTNTIIGGNMLTLWTLWISYLFILNLAYLLLK